MKLRAPWLLAALASLAFVPAARADDSAAVARLAEALRFRTISHADPAAFEPEPFVAFRGFVESSFPQVHATLRREVVAGHSLLYTWPGTDPAARPILLTSHYDVVPVPEDTLDSWEQPPFGGVVADGFVWGRGALDDKFGVLATLEAVERLLAEGFAPTRTIYLAFGHDEEIGGTAGAKGMTDLLESRGVRLEWSLDEGMAVVSGILTLDVPAAMIGVAEKGYVHMEITARAPGGHSSMPPRQSAIGRIARAVTRLEDNPMPANMDTIAGRTLDGLAPHVGGFQGTALRNRRLLGPIVERVLAGSPTTDALMRTTTAVTIMRAGVKSNVLPRSATATVNFRVLPGDTVAGIEEHVRKVVDDPELEIEVVSGSEASGVSSTESDGYGAIATAIGRVFPEAAITPGLVLGGTDSRHYGRIADDAYRFGPLEISPDDTARIHGVNERITASNYAKAIAFYEVLVRVSAGP